MGGGIAHGAILKRMRIKCYPDGPSSQRHWHSGRFRWLRTQPLRRKELYTLGTISFSSFFLKSPLRPTDWRAFQAQFCCGRNGCFWGRQKSFIDTELDELGRWQGNLTSVVGYAGGKKGAEPGSVCYYTGPQRTHYEDLGHAEVVKVDANNDEELRKVYSVESFPGTEAQRSASEWAYLRDTVLTRN